MWDVLVSPSHFTLVGWSIGQQKADNRSELRVVSDPQDPAQFFCVAQRSFNFVADKLGAWVPDVIVKISSQVRANRTRNGKGRERLRRMQM
jgi:hypothetical protein